VKVGGVSSLDQQLLIQDPTRLHFKNVSSLLSYIYYLTSNHLTKREVDYDSKELLAVHKGKSVLKLDKYISCAIPSPELEFVLESIGIMNYDCYLDPEFNWKHGICKSVPQLEEGKIVEWVRINGQSIPTYGDPKPSSGDRTWVLSEIFSPNISGDHFNPYVRFKSCISSSSRSCSLLMDLVGLEIKPVELGGGGSTGHDNIFLDLVCTFPSSVDRFLINPECRSKGNRVGLSRRSVNSMDFIGRMNKCRYLFFKKLHDLFVIPKDQSMGMSSSLHVWGSEIPILPNAHTHNIIPFFSYKKRVVRDPDFFKNLGSIVGGLDIFGFDYKIDFKDFLKEVFVEVDITSRNSNKPFESVQSFGSNKKLNNSKTLVVTSDKKIVEKQIVDRDKYKKLRLHLSSVLKEVVGHRQCSWYSSNHPVDIDKLKDLWSDIVYNEFQDIMDCWELLDIHVSWIPWYKKAKLRSALQYKVRPPVLDLDLFFKKCPGVVVGYDKLDLDKVLDYINYNLTIAIRCSDIDKINRYESLLKKAESIFNDFSESDIYSWLQFLSTWVTDTRVYGFWKNLKHYLLDPEHELLVVEEVCPICNGVYTDTKIKTKYCCVDFVLIQSQNKYLAYEVRDPGG